jgi:hypothetical protein
MYTPLLLIALTGLPAADVAEGPAWLKDYSSARKVGAEEKKPLAVFLAPGADAWHKVARDGKLGKEAEQLLSGSYVPVHINTSTEAGRKLAAAFEVESGTGLVISDRAGKLMAFHHDGDLSTAALTRHLTKFADPSHVVEETETNEPIVRQSYYPPAGQPAPVNYGYFGGFGGGRGGC